MHVVSDLNQNLSEGTLESYFSLYIAFISIVYSLSSCYRKPLISSCFATQNVETPEPALKAIDNQAAEVQARESNIFLEPVLFKDVNIQFIGSKEPTDVKFIIVMNPWMHINNKSFFQAMGGWLHCAFGEGPRAIHHMGNKRSFIIAELPASVDVNTKLGAHHPCEFFKDEPRFEGLRQMNKPAFIYAYNFRKGLTIASAANFLEDHTSYPDPEGVDSPFKWGADYPAPRLAPAIPTHTECDRALAIPSNILATLQPLSPRPRPTPPSTPLVQSSAPEASVNTNSRINREKEVHGRSSQAQTVGKVGKLDPYEDDERASALLHSTSVELGSSTPHLSRVHTQTGEEVDSVQHGEGAERAHESPHRLGLREESKPSLPQGSQVESNEDVSPELREAYEQYLKSREVTSRVKTEERQSRSLTVDSQRKEGNGYIKPEPVDDVLPAPSSSSMTVKVERGEDRKDPAGSLRFKREDRSRQPEARSHASIPGVVKKEKQEEEEMRLRALQPEVKREPVDDDYPRLRAPESQQRPPSIKSEPLDVPIPQHTSSSTVKKEEEEDRKWAGSPERIPPPAWRKKRERNVDAVFGDDSGARPSSSERSRVKLEKADPPLSSSSYEGRSLPTSSRVIKHEHEGLRGALEQHATHASLAVAASLERFSSTSLDLKPFFNNVGASSNGSANFDNHGGSFDSQFLPTGVWEHDGVSYDFPSTWGSANDNVIAMGQVVPLESPSFVHEAHFLFAGDDSGDGDFAVTVTLNFADNTTQPLAMQAKNWWSWPLLNTGVIQTPYSFLKNGTSLTKNFNVTQIYQWSSSIPSEQPLTSITLPASTSSRGLHFFAIAFSSSSNQSESSEPALVVRRARFTSRWETVGDARAQVVEVTLANLLPANTLATNTSLNSKHTIEISGPGIETVTPGVVNRLVPGDQVRVDVLVTGVQNGTNATVEVKDKNGESVGTSDGWAASPLIEHWTPDASVLAKHETPTWWNKAKYGILRVTSSFSYPAWSPPDSYAEWYDWWLHEDPHNTSNPTFQHHLETFGKARIVLSPPTVTTDYRDVVYDDFIANFTASKFNASQWVDLFDRAGAKYFVLVTKHHDGYALFDTGNTTHRSSVFSGPKRDLVAELFETSAREKPELHRGTYYSLPEWFNPDYAKYGFSQWPGGLARNVFNLSELEPYTGRLEISDYLDDLQLPHMLQLATQYETEIMWCDIGGPNKTLDFAAQYYNLALEQGRQVTINNRCGAVPDFATPEYSTFSSIQPTSWESSEGMDPFSYGYNSATNASQYKNGTTLVRTLVDIVSKGGNFLIDVGPTAEGEIIAPMADNLLDAGAWLQHSGDCVYDTNFWFQGSQDINVAPDANAARFTTTPETFCIVTFDPPADGQLIINKRLPLLPGDEVRFLNPNTSEALPWSVDDSTGQLTVNVSSASSQIDEMQFGWAFQVKFKLD
ncbi:hypothetical protein V5O48_012122 [Marasmius crinis-equi]|uniref:alpha-L-fucosidase n=1 Tax=Marasmius crinis-equi TaxID=585013 RepID=A0ABR3F3M9_9AGAR